MKRNLLLLPSLLLVLFVFLFATSCEDETSKIGPSIAPGEVNITIDSITYDINASVKESDIFDSRSGNLLLGNLEIPEYGKLNCSFVTRLMCAPKLNVPDSLFFPERVDSCKFMMTVVRGNLTGDSLSPQKVAVYMLNKQLPSDINNLFDPTGYYDPSNPMGSRSFIVSNIAGTDTAYIKRKYVSIDVPLGEKFGKEIFEKYKNEPEIFQWPQTLAEYIPGFFVNQTFGKGCVVNISEAFVAVYYHKKVEVKTIVDKDTTIKVVNQRDSVLPFTISPEVLSSNKVTYNISEFLRQRIDDGETILTTPSGFSVNFKFPAAELIERYESMNKNLSTISELLFSIPAESIDNNMGIGYAPNLLMIKTKDVEDFFAKNKIPDGLSSFTATYNSVSKKYQFSSLRNYITSLIKKGEIEEEDVDFTIIPVDISYEEVGNNYTGSSSTYVTKCVPYALKPTVTKLDTKNTLIVFSFSSQIID